MNGRILIGTALLLALLFVANGSYMIFSPEAWYTAVLGDGDRGAFNQHFIRDIGMLYVVTGVAFSAGALYPAQRVALWSLAAAWHLSHALFHLWEVLVGLCGPAALADDFAGVTLPSVIAVALAVAAWRTSATRRGLP